MKRSLVVLLVVAAVLLVGAGTGETASNVNCTGALPPGTYNNVTVPAGASCTIDGSRILGSVTVKTGASLDTQNNNGDTTVAGNITGNTSSATLDSRGAQAGAITVTCNVSDDRNPALTASSTTTVNVEAAPPPAPRPEIVAIEKRLALHSIYFATAKPSKENPDAGLLPSQEKTLTALASDFKLGNFFFGHFQIDSDRSSQRIPAAPSTPRLETGRRRKAGLLAYRVSAIARLPEASPQWHFERLLAGYSCGGSRGLNRVPFQIPLRGTLRVLKRGGVYRIDPPPSQWL